MAVTSVDGVNVISGETAAVNQSGYVFYAWQAYDIAGWRKSNQEIAAFTFTSIPKSYAARTGRPQNVGVIGVALFRERYVPPPPPAPVGNVGPGVPPAAASSAARDQQEDMELEERQVTGSRALPPSAPSGSAGPGGGAARGGAPGGGSGRAGGAASGAAAGIGQAEQSQSSASPSLGTGHGRREASAVVNVAFERAQATPDEVIRIRYDSHDNLVAMGVIPPAPQPRPLDPFPNTPDRRYVPDP
jgi:hypothetical protein